MNTPFLVIAPALLFVAIVMDFLPRRPRRGLYFGVTTGAPFALSPEGRTIASRYRLVIWAAFAIAIGMAYAGFALAAVPVQASLGLLAWLRAWRRASHHATAPGTVRAAPLQYDERISSWIAPLLLASFAILAAAAALLYLNFNALPDRFPTHYGMNGKADAFAAKSYGTVFLPLVVGALVSALMALNVYGIAYGSRRGGSPETQGFRIEQRRFLSRLLAALGLVVSLMCSYIAVSPVTSNVGLPGGPWVIPASVAGILGLSLWSVLRWQEHAGGPGDDTPDSCWKGGMIYYNAEDPALMVERRNGLGYTPNFAQPLGWAMIVLVAMLVAAPFLLHSLG